MSENQPTASALDAFRTRHERGIAAFNRGDFAHAFAGVSPEFEFHPDPAVPEGRVVRGLEDVVRYFDDARASFPDWHTDPVEYKDAGAGRFLVTSRLGGTGRASGLVVDAEVFHVWETSDGRVVRLREFFDRDHALADLGLEE